jgi:hypothetical protein
MNIELGKLPDGGLIIMADGQFTHDIRRVEYYRDQRLIMLIYDDPEHEGELMHYELPDVAAHAVEASPSVMVIDKSPDRKLYGYDVPLVQVGAL